MTYVPETSLKVARVRLTKRFICPHCTRQVAQVERHDTSHYVELFCLNAGCGVLITQKPRTV